MAKKDTSKFNNGDYVALQHSVCGLPENMVGYVSNTEKNRREEIEVVINGTPILIKTKYLGLVNPRRFSKKFDNGDNAKLMRHYERFLTDSIVKILSNYLGTNNKIVVKDERGITGGVPETLLIRIA